MTTFIRWLLIGVGAAVVCGVVLLEQRKVTVLRAEAVWLREQEAERLRLAKANELLRAAQPSAEELAARARERTELERLKNEVPALRERLEGLSRPVAVVEEPEGPRPAETWRNVGRGTPGAAMETALWAALNGELEVLAGMLVFAPGARERAEALLAELPDRGGASYGTPEKLIALLGAKEVTFREMQVMGLSRRSEDEVRLRLRLQNEKLESRATNIGLRRLADGWRLVVPESAVVRYGALLKVPAGG